MWFAVLVHETGVGGDALRRAAAARTAADNECGTIG